MKPKQWRQGVVLSSASWEFLASILWSGSLPKSATNKKHDDEEKPGHTS